MKSGMIFEKVHSILDHSGVDFKLHYHEPVVTVAQAHTLVPHLTGNLIKTVVFRIKDGPWILVGVNGSDRIHYKYLADVFGVNRKLIRSVAAPEVETGLGFELGWVGPFPVAPDVDVILEQSLMDLPYIRCGSGKNTVTVEISPKDLAMACHTKIAPVIKQ